MTKDEAINQGAKLNRRNLPTLKAFQAQFKDEEACRQHFFGLRWPDGPRCPRCGNAEVKKVKRPWSWQCRKCDKNGYRFSLTTGTVFENTKYPLQIWFQVLYLMLQSKKGMSALQIHRTIGSGDYRTAWYICHRIRAAMQSDEIMKLSGEVEIDETYVGGKNRNRHKSKRVPKRTSKRGGGINCALSDKVTVIGAISRKGNVVAQVVDSLDAKTTGGFVKKVISDQVELVATDESSIYNFMKHPGWTLGYPALPHESVNHSEEEYVRGKVHTGSIDNFWSLLKRGIMGTFHNVRRDYLPMYVNEFAFRHNHRNDPAVFDHVLSRS